MAKISIKSEKITPFGGIFHVREQFSRFVGPVIDNLLGLRCTSYGYQSARLRVRWQVSILSTGQLVAGASYDLDFDHQFIETEKYDAKMTYKKFTGRIKAFVFKFISVPAKWIRTVRHYQLNIYSCNNAYADVFQNDFE